MFLANLATYALSHVPSAAAWIFQEAAVGWDPVSLWKQMGWLARIVVIILFIMSAWSIGVMIDRAMAFSAARKQSRAFAPAVAGALREGKIEEAIKVGERNKKSHLAKVVTAGLQEFKAHGDSADIPGEQIEASKRALERAEAITHAELKRGLGGLATIGSTAPFVGLLGHRGRHSERVQRDFDAEGHRSGRCRRRYFGSAGDHRHRTLRRDPGRHDVQLLHQQGGGLRRGNGQQLQRADRLFPEDVGASAGSWRSSALVHWPGLKEVERIWQ